MSTIITLFDLHTRLFHNALVGITNDLSGKQAHPNANHIQFVAGHLVYTRLMMKDFAGLEADARFDAFDKNMDPQKAYLPLADILAKWDEIAPRLSEGLKAVPTEMLASNAPFPTPAGVTVEDFLGFLMHHEAYHIGQLGILRKMASQEAMSYN